jgi:hypothetical protein
MTNSETEKGIRKNYRVRNQRLADALRNDATRVHGRPRVRVQKCSICHRKEDGGGLIPYRQRDGEELFIGDRCAHYLEYLTAQPARRRQQLLSVLI